MGAIRKYFVFTTTIICILLTTTVEPSPGDFSSLYPPDYEYGDAELFISTEHSFEESQDTLSSIEDTEGEDGFISTRSKPKPSHAKDPKKSKEEMRKMNALMNPKAPIDLPIVKEDMEELESEPAAIRISTKGRPFHFHIPIIDPHPEKPLPLDQLMEIAKKYKNPLTLDPVIYKAAVVGQILTEADLETMKRTERDSATMDFLNIPLGSEEDGDNKKGSASRSSRERAGEEDVYLMAGKRSIINVTATQEILQELLMDRDDYMALGQMMTTTKKPSKAKTDKITTAKTKTTHASASIRSSTPRTKGTSTKKNKRHTPEDIYSEESTYSADEEIRPLKIRSKRGLGKWLKKVFGFGGKTTMAPTTTTTTTTRRPPPPPPQLHYLPGDIVSLPEGGGKGGLIVISLKENGTAREGSTEPDANGDTEVDFLLPVDLRRSTWLKNHANDNDD